MYTYSLDRNPQFKILNFIIVIELKSTISLREFFYFKKIKISAYFYQQFPNQISHFSHNQNENIKHLLYLMGNFNSFYSIFLV